MPFYDNDFARGDSISQIGKWIVAREVQNRMQLPRSLSEQSTLKTLEPGPGEVILAGPAHAFHGLSQ